MIGPVAGSTWTVPPPANVMLDTLASAYAVALITIVSDIVKSNDVEKKLLTSLPSIGVGVPPVVEKLSPATPEKSTITSLNVTR